MEAIEMERSGHGIAFFRNVWNIANSRFENFAAHPMLLDLHLSQVWDSEA